MSCAGLSDFAFPYQDFWLNLTTIKTSITKSISCVSEKVLRMANQTKYFSANVIAEFLKDMLYPFTLNNYNCIVQIIISAIV